MTFPSPKPAFPHARLRRTASLCATFAIAGLIAVMTLLPINLPADGVTGSDKVNHFIAFAALTFPTALIYRRAVIWVAPCALLFGALIELIQPHVGRQGEMADFYADAFGVVVGLCVGLAANTLLVHPFARKYLNRNA